MAIHYSRKHTRIAAFLSISCLCFFFSDHIKRQSSFAISRIPLEHIYSALPGHHDLLPFVLAPLPLGTISPSGWLRDQMQLMANGLAGHEHDFYKYVARSSWLGGDAEYSALNEGFPYWFNGLVPLAYGLNDDRLKGQVHAAADYVLAHQAEDGWLGPEKDSDRLVWARFPLCLGLLQLAEANYTWQAPVLQSLYKFNRVLNNMLKDDGLGYIMQRGGDWRFTIFTWGRVRSADMVITLQWLYDHHPANESAILLENMRYLHDYSLKWENWYGSYHEKHMHEDLYMLPENDTLPYYHYQHAVNVAQGLKSAAVIRRFTYNESLVQSAKDAVNWTMTYHGAPSGTIVGDERIVGLSPHSGSELCTTVELMYSLAYLYQATGDRDYADKAEMAAFNALSASFTPDYWAHLYVVSTNQPSAKNRSSTLFYNTNSWSQTFGLEPHYPCCTVNHPQGWPKFASHSFAKVGTNGVAHALLGPGRADVLLSSGMVTVEAETAYPFADDIRYRVHASGPADLYIRVPSWAGDESGVSIDGSDSVPLSPDRTTGLHRIQLQAGETTIAYHLRAAVRVQLRANQAVSVFRGSLLYALDVKHKGSPSTPKMFTQPHAPYAAKYAPPQSRDWEYRSASAWNIAIDPWTLEYHEPSFAKTSDISNPVFSSDANTGYITVQGCEIDWPVIEDGVPDAPPMGEDRRCTGKRRVFKLIPFGGAKLHMAEMPIIEFSRKAE